MATAEGFRDAPPKVALACYRFQERVRARLARATRNERSRLRKHLPENEDDIVRLLDPLLWRHLALGVRGKNKEDETWEDVWSPNRDGFEDLLILQARWLEKLLEPWFEDRAELEVAFLENLLRQGDAKQRRDIGTAETDVPPASRTHKKMKQRKTKRAKKTRSTRR